MDCPKCGGWARCIDGRRLKTETTYRRRYQCIKCAERFTTAEVSLAVLNAARSILDRLAEIRFTARIRDGETEAIEHVLKDSPGSEGKTEHEN